MSMNYAQAVSSGKAPKPSPVPTPEKKVEAPKPQPVTTADQAAQPQAPVQEAKTYEGNKGGPVIGQLTNGVHCLAHALAPADLIALGSTCKHLFTMFLNTNTWNLTQSYKLPKTSKAFVRLEVRVPLRKDDEGEEAGFSTSDVEADGLVTEGNTVVVYPSFFRREQRKQQLVQIWQNQAAKVQKARDKVDENADPLTTTNAKKSPLSMKFPGGFAVSFRDAPRGPKGEKPVEKNEEFLARGIDLSEVASWLDGVYRLINGEKKVQFNTAGGNLSLTRHGRGGSMLVAKSTGKNATQTIFSLSDFAVQIRSAAKEFVPILGRLNVIINQDSKKITGKEEGAAYLEFEKCVASAIKQEKLVNAIGRIKSSLERGSIPHSNIQQLLQKKREKKKLQQKASESENSNILDFIYANLPKDLEDVRRQAEKQTADAKEHRDQKYIEKKAADKKRKDDEIAAKEKKQEEKKNKQNQKNNQKNKEEQEEDENKKKTITKSVKTTDEEGFVTVDTQYVKKGETGQVVGTAKASDKLKSDIEKANEQKSKKTENQGTDVVLQNNPYAQIKRAGGLQSQKDIQEKINKQKGEKRNAENNENQPKGAKAPPPPKPKQQQKKPKPAKTDLKSSGGNSSSDSETSQQLATAAAVGVNPQPILMGAFALAVAVLSYVFLLS